METRDLRYFLICAELGHLQRAARRVGRTQPALTKSIRRLEAALATRLFEREGRGLRLTPMGKTLEAHARKLLRGMEEAVGEVRRVADGRVGHVRLGTGPTMAEWLLPDVFVRMLNEGDGLTFEVRFGLGEELRRDLRDGRLDLAIVQLWEGDHERFAVVPLEDDVMVVATRRGHPLEGRRLTCADLCRFRWMLPPLASLHWVQITFARQGLPPPSVQIEANSVVGLRRLLARTDLITLISRRDLRHIPGAELCELDAPDLLLRRRFGLLSSRDRETTSATHHVIMHLAGDQLGRIRT